MSRQLNHVAGRRSAHVASVLCTALCLSGCLAATEVDPLEVAQTESPLLYCNRTYAQLGTGIGQPYNAVGYLSNGCTAFLIGPNTIATAAHCLADTVFGGTGAWDTTLRFYPNFTPERVDLDPKSVPSADVVRAVVGARVNWPFRYRADWGIARLANWRKIGGLDLTPIALSSNVPTAENTPITNPSYTRHHFPYNDSAAPHWDDMAKTTNCGGPEGWAILMDSAPIISGTTRDRENCNSRWGYGYVHDGCVIREVADQVVRHNCDVVGGSSGSPVLGIQNGNWFAFGVTSGGALTDFAVTKPDGSVNVPTCTPYDRNRLDQLNESPSVERFIHAPRYAFNVAVHRNVTGLGTGVYAVDSERDLVLVRQRTGAAPQTQLGEFTFWGSLGTPVSGSSLLNIAACSHGGGTKPQVFVISDGKLFSRAALTNAAAWGSWQSFALPANVTSAIDVDVTTDPSGRCQLMIVATDGDVYTRVKTGDSATAWGAWSSVAAGSFVRLTALNYAGIRHVAMLDTAGAIWRTQRSGAGWITPVKLPGQAGTSFLDIDMTLDEYGRGFILTVERGFTGTLKFMPMYGPEAFTRWNHFQTSLFAPMTAAAETAPSLRSITASNWQEDPAGTFSPVIFGTDDQGNVYFIEYTRNAAPRWILEWKSFYDEAIPYTF